MFVCQTGMALLTHWPMIQEIVSSTCFQPIIKKVTTIFVVCLAWVSGEHFHPGLKTIDEQILGKMSLAELVL